MENLNIFKISIISIILIIILSGWYIIDTDITVTVRHYSEISDNKAKKIINKYDVHKYYYLTIDNIIRKVKTPIPFIYKNDTIKRNFNKHIISIGESRTNKIISKS